MDSQPSFGLDTVRKAEFELVIEDVVKEIPKRKKRLDRPKRPKGEVKRYKIGDDNLTIREWWEKTHDKTKVKLSCLHNRFAKFDMGEAYCSVEQVVYTRGNYDLSKKEKRALNLLIRMHVEPKIISKKIKVSLNTVYAHMRRLSARTKEVYLPSKLHKKKVKEKKLLKHQCIYYIDGDETNKIPTNMRVLTKADYKHLTKQEFKFNG